MKLRVLGLPLIAMLGACSSSGGGDTPAAAVEEFTRKIDTGRCVNLRNYIASNMREEVGEGLEMRCTSRTELRRKMPGLDQERLKAIHVLDAQENGDRAIVRAEFETMGGTREGPESYSLVKEDGSWRIDLLATMQANSGGAAPGQPGGPGAPGAPGGPGVPGGPGAPAPGGQPPIVTAPEAPAAPANEAAPAKAK